MALWGKTDALISKPKWVARKATFNSATAVNTTANTISLVASNTGFSLGDAVYYSKNGGTEIGGMTDGTTYYVRPTAAGVITLYDTEAHALAGGATGLVDLTTAGVGVQTLQRTGAANTTGYDHTWNGEGLFFVDRTEAQQPENRAKGFRGPGWWLYKTYTDANGSVKHRAEMLVALNVPVSTSGDSADDAILPDGTITVTAPSNTTIIDGATGTIGATASASPTASLTYLWQVSTNGGTSWSDLSNAGVYSDVDTATMTITAPTYTYNNYKYRLSVAATGYTTAYSNAATLTVTPVTIGISAEPTNQSVVAPATATFSVTAATTPSGRTLTYTWEKSTDTGTTWSTIAGATSASYTTPATVVGDDGAMFRVTVSRTGATPVVSDEVTLTVTE